MENVSIEQLQAQLAELTARLAALEHHQVAQAVSPADRPQPTETISEEELLAISAAIGAYLGVRPHIRHIRLVSGGAWAQQGRVSIQASHRLQG